MTDHPTRQFTTIAEVVNYGRAHGLRGISTAIVTSPAADRSEWVISAAVTVGDSAYTAHASGPQLEAAENKAIARALSLALGVSIGNGTPA